MSVAKEKFARGDRKDGDSRASVLKLSQSSCPSPRQSVSRVFTGFNISTTHGIHHSTMSLLLLKRVLEHVLALSY